MASRTAQAGLQTTGGVASSTYANSVAGGCIGYVTRNTSTSAVTSTTLADITGVSITFSANANRLLELEFWATSAANSDTSTYGKVAIVEGSNVLVSSTTGLSAAGVGTGPAVTAKYLWRGPSSGSHTVKAQVAKNTGAGSVTIVADVDREMFLKVTDLGPNF